MYNQSPYAEPRSSYVQRVIPPTTEPDEGPFVLVAMPIDWLPFVVGALSQLVQRTTWETDTEEELQLAIDRSRLLINLLGGPILSLPGISVGVTILLRYNPSNGHVETSIDGGENWTVSTYADPRTHHTLNPPTGSNANCNAAASEIAYLGRVIEILYLVGGTGITATSLAYGIMGVLLELSEGYAIIFAVIVAACEGLLTAGLTALQAAFSSTNLATLQCILYCNTVGGQLSEAGLSAAEADVTALIGSTSATLINAVLSLQGYGGITQAMALNLDTDDCSGCSPCDECQGVTATFTASVTDAPNCPDWNNVSMDWRSSSGHNDAGCAICTHKADATTYDGGVMIDLGRECHVTDVGWWARMLTSGGGSVYAIAWKRADHTQIAGTGLVGQTGSTSWTFFHNNSSRLNCRYIEIYMQGGSNHQPMIDDFYVSVGS